MHYAHLPRKCLLHRVTQYVDAMATAGERLKQARLKAGYASAATAAEAMGVSPATYAQHENGTRGFPASRAERYGRFFRVAPEWLLYGRQKSEGEFSPLGPQLFVKGEAAAGQWKEAWEFEPDDWEVFTGRADVSAPIRERFGLRIVGESMNEVYPHGSVIECVAYSGDYEIPSGKRVVVKRTRFDGTIETTVKELIRTEEGTVWLRPRSTNPEFRAFRGDEPDDPDIASIEIIGAVVASIRPE
jgi:phage repressor protein C with HTH and peptisase S24 domain